ncbi:LysR substrate-binding domain-containing protein [Roseibium salinum]|nr:LysR substrate-binding domain-containing protein [Roseibium salinum]
MDEAEAILERLETSKRTLRGLANREHGQLRIAGIPEAVADFLPNSLAQFIADKPSVKVALASRTSTEIEELIAAQHYDIGFAETPRARNSFDQVDFDLECMCAIPASDPLAAREVITPTELDGYPLALLHHEHRSHKQTLARFRDAGVRFNQRFELQTASPGLRFVEAGLCAPGLRHDHGLQGPGEQPARHGTTVDRLPALPSPRPEQSFHPHAHASPHIHRRQGFLQLPLLGSRKHPLGDDQEGRLGVLSFAGTPDQLIALRKIALLAATMATAFTRFFAPSRVMALRM